MRSWEVRDDRDEERGGGTVTLTVRDEPRIRIRDTNKTD
jgi:hypothetical protein